MRCVIVERDSTLIRDIPDLCDPDKVEVLPFVVEGFTELIKVGAKLFIHTNQSGVERVYFSMADAIACNKEMLRRIGLGSDIFEDICVCPETPEKNIIYRKPPPKIWLRNN